MYILTAVCAFFFLEIVQVTVQCDFSPFDGLHSLNLAARRRYCSRQLNVLLSSNAVLKGYIALSSLSSVSVISHHCFYYYAVYCAVTISL